MCLLSHRGASPPPLCMKLATSGPNPPGPHSPTLSSLMLQTYGPLSKERKPAYLSASAGWRLVVRTRAASPAPIPPITSRRLLPSTDPLMRTIPRAGTACTPRSSGEGKRKGGSIGEGRPCLYVTRTCTGHEGRHGGHGSQHGGRGHDGL